MGNPPLPPKPRFSKQFDAAVTETLITDAMVKADGWELAQFVHAPPWIMEMYNRHATAAYQQIQEIEKTENELKPSEHE